MKFKTVIIITIVNHIVPANKLTIFDDNNNNINDIAGPFNEDEPLNLTCISEGGHPIPKVRWWKGEQLINDGDDGDISVSNVIIDNNKSLIIVKNVIKFKKMLRKHLMMPITCESMNTNLTVPITKTILIDLNCKLKQ